MRIKFPKVLTVSILAIASSVSIAHAAWAPPTVEPTGGNIAAPLNTSATGQEKDGGLVLWDYLIVGNSTTVYGGITLPRPLGVTVTKGAGPSVMFQSPSTETTTVPGTPDFCNEVGECSSTMDDDPGQSLTAPYVCPPASGGNAYLYDIYEDSATSERYHRAVNCVADMSAYSIRTNDGTLEFLKNDGSTAKFTLGQDGSVAMGPSAASFVINPSGNTSLGGTLDVTSASNGDAITITSSDTSANVDGTTGSGSILVNTPWLKFWNTTGTKRASIYADNGDFDGTGNFDGAVTALSFSGPLTGDVTGNADTATNATNLSGGDTNQILVQTGSGTTGFIDTGTADQVLTYNATGKPSWKAPAPTGAVVPTGTAGQTLRYSASGALATSSVIFNNGDNVGIGTTNPNPTNKLSVQGNVGLLRTPGTNISAGVGPELSLESPSTEYSGRGDGWIECGSSVGTTCPSDGWNGNSTSQYDCTAADTGLTKIDVYKYGTATNQYYYTNLNCIAGTGVYSLRTNNGTLEFLNNDATVNLSLEQTGGLGIDTTASSVTSGTKLAILGNGGSTNLVSGQAGGHTFLGFYNGLANGLRSAWAGFGSNGSTDLTLKNEAGGKIVLDSTGDVTVTNGLTATTLKLTTGAGDKKILTSDASGTASWADAASGMPDGTADGDTLRYDGTKWATSTVITNNGANIDINGNGGVARLVSGQTSGHTYLSFFRGLVSEARSAWAGFGSNGDTDFTISNEAGGDIVLLSGAGNVGIGTTAPSADLEVKGNFQVEDSVKGSMIVAIPGNSYAILKDAATHFNVGDSIKVVTTSNGSITGDILSFTGDQINFTNSTNSLFGSNGTYVATFYKDANLLKLTTSTDNPKLTVDKSGNMGIGTTAPTVKLDVYAAGGAGAMQQIAAFESTRAGATDGTYIGIYDNTGGVRHTNSNIASINGNLAFQTNGGNVGIGTTDPFAKLFVAGGFYNTKSGANQDAYALGAQSIAASDSIYSYGSICTGNSYGNCTGSSGTVIGTSNTAAANNIPDSGDVFFTSGNVGIGTPAPGSLLTVGSGSFPVQQLPGINVATNGNSYVTVSDNTRQVLFGVDTSDYGMVGTYSNHDFVTRTNNVERMRITKTGGTSFTGGISATTGTFTSGLDVGNNGGTHSSITMRDDNSPNGVKYIHANSDNIGFLSGDGSKWLTRWDDAGNQVNTGSISATTISATTGTFTGSSVFAQNNNTGTAYWSAPIQIREAQYGATSSYLPPRLSFHWGGVVASQLAIESDGTIAVKNDPGTGYEKFRTGPLTATTGTFSGDMTSQRWGPKYTTWSGIGDGGAAIVNSNEAAYKALMVVGNNSADGSTRVVKVWDNLQVQGPLSATTGTFTSGLDVGNSGGGLSSIIMRDDESPNGLKYIHANSNNIGFLSGDSTRWLTRWDDAGNQVNTGGISATTGTFSGDMTSQRWGPKYTTWSGIGDGGAAIVNSNEAAYKALMVVGNNSADGSTRVVKVWDNLQVQGPLSATTISGTTGTFTGAIGGTSATFSGNVGIGTEPGLYNLNVLGNSLFSGILEIQNDRGSNALFVNQKQTAFPIATFRANNSEKMVIYSSGNVNIGGTLTAVTSDSTTLKINGKTIYRCSLGTNFWMCADTTMLSGGSGSVSCAQYYLTNYCKSGTAF